MSEPQQALDERISAWLDGELPPADAQALERRVAEDPALAARVRELRAVDDALRATPLPELSPAIAERLRARLADEAPARRAPRRRARWLAPALAAAAAALLALLVLPRLRGQPTDAPSPLAHREAPASPRAPESPQPELSPVEPRPPAVAEVPEPSDEELPLALASAEEGEDLEVIELLDWLEALGDLEPGSARRTPDPRAPRRG